MKLRIACLVGGLLLALPVAAEEAEQVSVPSVVAGEVTMMAKGQPVVLAPPVQEKLATSMKALLESCRINSKTSPRGFNKLNGELAFDWQRATDPLRNTSYLMLSLDKLEKLRAGNRSVYAQELLLETPPGSWPAKYLAINDGNTSIQFARCSGLVVVDIICIPEVLASLPEGYARACSVLPPDSSGLVE